MYHEYPVNRQRFIVLNLTINSEQPNLNKEQNLPCTAPVWNIKANNTVESIVHSCQTLPLSISIIISRIFYFLVPFIDKV